MGNGFCRRPLHALDWIFTGHVFVFFPCHFPPMNHTCSVSLGCTWHISTCVWPSRCGVHPRVLLYAGLNRCRFSEFMWDSTRRQGYVHLILLPSHQRWLVPAEVCSLNVKSPMH